eukprot:TRINITY_DN875_c0_g1_i3.p1 TRINITY_DN875_c0_g1~~TRINITY_DN875_c0_g1_i3.p1  ORF type:complete len:247 (+),score=61.74 TRINITY_DN875_c0_g1_i3:38-778(+)
MRGGYSGAPGYGAPPPGRGGYSAAETRQGGKVKSVLIGINYVGQQGQLSGCCLDVQTMQGVLKQAGISTASGYQEMILVDDKKSQFPQSRMPTKREILSAFKWLASGNSPGDTLFLHYSGHGGQQKDTSGDEEDGYDETLIPCDYRKAGVITDDDVFDILVRDLPAGVRLTAVMDCCHSGSAMDLPFEFRATEGSNRDPNMYCESRGKKIKKEKKQKKQKKEKKDKKDKKDKKEKKKRRKLEEDAK